MHRLPRREFHHGESFRWTEPVVTFRLALPPESYEVAIETRALRGSPSDYLRACFWNDHLIPRQAMTVTDGVVRFPIRREYFVAGETQQFSVICRHSGRVTTAWPTIGGWACRSSRFE